MILLLEINGLKQLDRIVAQTRNRPTAEFYLQQVILASSHPLKSSHLCVCAHACSIWCDRQPDLSKTLRSIVDEE